MDFAMLLFCFQAVAVCIVLNAGQGLRDIDAQADDDDDDDDEDDGYDDDAAAADDDANDDLMMPLMKLTMMDQTINTMFLNENENHLD